MTQTTDLPRALLLVAAARLRLTAQRLERHAWKAQRYIDTATAALCCLMGLHLLITVSLRIFGLR